uniref:Uncharacterized protein n=1 Tax=Arundo donax TaxID=35708 RepID=A0A0A9C6K1_ARUDO
MFTIIHNDTTPAVLFIETFMNSN